MIEFFSPSHAFNINIPIYHRRKVVRFVLFCSYEDPLNQDASDHVLGVFGKLSTRRSACAWFHDVWTCGAKVLEY